VSDGESAGLRWALDPERGIRKRRATGTSVELDISRPLLFSQQGKGEAFDLNQPQLQQTCCGIWGRLKRPGTKKLDLAAGLG